MKLPDMYRALIRVSILLGTAAAVPAVAGTVVAASGPSASRHPVGTKLADSASITLQSNDVVTILDARGTRVLRGPGTFPVAQTGGGARPSVYSALVSNRVTQRVRTGSVRTGATQQTIRPSNLWYVDIARPGTYCLVNPAAVRFWRATTGATETAELSEGASRRQLSFSTTDMVAPLTGSVEAGKTYDLRTRDGKVVGKYRFEQITAPSDDMEELALALIAKGCTEQLATLDATVRQSDR
jgi:hypothetical protein